LLLPALSFTIEASAKNAKVNLAGRLRRTLLVDAYFVGALIGN
jgi:hypothetical protein